MVPLLEAPMRCSPLASNTHELTRLGYGPGPEDGILGLRTRTAVNTFQRDQGLPDGEDITAQFLKRVAKGTVENGAV